MPTADDLPAGYQFGDGCELVMESRGRRGEVMKVTFGWCPVHGWINHRFGSEHVPCGAPQWRPMHENAAEQLDARRRLQESMTGQ